MTTGWTVEHYNQGRLVLYFEWETGHRYNQMVKVGDFSELGTFHTWNSDVLLAVF